MLFDIIADETDDPRKIFDFLYKNVQEVTPPPDLNLNDPNLHRQQDRHEGVYYKPVEKVSFSNNKDRLEHFYDNISFT